jgi:2-polyprenyl-3-methyl-5-hydroxy-6-metoxy-1,4-benzoquinol methylase
MSWDDEADTWDDDPAVQAYSRAAFRSLQAVLDEAGVLLAGARVLDFGCGTGLLTAAMAAQAEHVVGLDLSKAMVDRLRAKRLPNVRALSGLVADHELGPFDLITCSSVCAFVPDYPAVADTLTRLLAPGGLFVQWDWEFDPAVDDSFGLTRSAMHQALVGAGLEGVLVRVGFQEPFGDQTMAPLLGTGQRSC